MINRTPLVIIRQSCPSQLANVQFMNQGKRGTLEHQIYIHHIRVSHQNIVRNVNFDETNVRVFLRTENLKETLENARSRLTEWCVCSR